MTKLLENIHRAVNIGLVNELKTVCDRLGLDTHEVIRAAATKPFGFTPYYPGPGLGGHCIPIDPFYLTWKARADGLSTRFTELAGEVNATMPQWVVSKVADARNDRGQALKGAKILVLGIAYQKNVDDRRESPALVLMELLQAKGAAISYADPHMPRLRKMRRHDFALASVPLTPETLAAADGVLLATYQPRPLRRRADQVPRAAHRRHPRALPGTGRTHRQSQAHRANRIRDAEAAKVSANTPRDPDIALMNERVLIFGKLGIDPTTSPTQQFQIWPY